MEIQAGESSHDAWNRCTQGLMECRAKTVKVQELIDGLNAYVKPRPALEALLTELKSANSQNSQDKQIARCTEKLKSMDLVQKYINNMEKFLKELDAKRTKLEGQLLNHP